MDYNELTIRVSNIVWDVESEDWDEEGEEDTTQETLDSLPVEDELVLTVLEGYTEEELMDDITETLSDFYGFLIDSYNYEIVED